MSKRSIPRPQSVRPRLGVLALTLLLLAAMTGPLQAQDGTVIVIDSLTDVGLNQEIQISVRTTQVDPDHAFGGFELFLAYDFHAMKLLDIQPGPALTDCNWEFFNYFTGPFDCGDLPYDCNGGLVRIVGFAEEPGGDDPTCFLESPGELVQLTFLTTSSPEFLDNAIPILFDWFDCASNAFSNLTGDTLLVSDRVYYFGNDVTDPYADLPSYFGLPQSCIQDTNTIIRAIDFYHGYVTFAPADTLDLAPLVSIIAGDSLYYFAGDTLTAAIELSQSDTAPFDIGGFDLLIQYEEPHLTFLSASPGNLYDTCGWEYFNARIGPIGDCPEIPGLIRLVALADVNNGPVYPACYGSTGGELATIDFYIPWDTTEYTRIVDFGWQWCDCGDNAFTDVSGDSLYLSEVVLDEYGFPIAMDTTLPSAGGAPNSCLMAGNTVRRFNYMGDWTRIAYYEGDIDGRGDINLNGISNEIADYLLFVEYFLYGLGAFTIDLEAQVAATDINADGLALSLADLVYQYRIIVGDTLPIESGDKGAAAVDTLSDTVVVIQDYDGRRIGLQFDQAPSALILHFDDAIYPDFEPPNHDITYWADTGLTHMVITPSFEYQGGLPYLEQGLLFSYSDQGKLWSAWATYDGILSPVAVVAYGSVSCCENRGDIDGSGDPEINIADLVYLVDHMFLGGPEPPCLEHADVNGSGGDPDIEDLVYLVNYMFNFGPPPVPCP